MKNMLKLDKVILLTCSVKDKKIYHCHGFSGINLEKRTCFIENQHCIEQIFG